MRAKLTLAFAVIVALFSLAMATSARGFRALETEVGALQDRTLPRVLALQELGHRLSSLTGDARDLTTRESMAEVSEASRRFGEARSRLTTTLGAAGARGTQLTLDVDAFTEAFADLVEQQQQNLRNRSEARTTALELDARAGELIDELEVALLLAAGQPAAIESLRELRVGLLLLRQTSARMIDAPDELHITEMREHVRLLTRQATLQLAVLDGDRHGSIRTGIAAYMLRLNEKDELYARWSVQRSSTRAVAQQSERVETLASNLQIEALILAEQARATSEASVAAASRTARTARARVRSLWWITLAASLGIVWFYVQHGVINRLEWLAEDLNHLANGDLEVAIRGGGDRELALVAAAAEVFRRNSRDLAKSLDELEHRNAQLSEFTYVASHDLKSPMRAIAHLSSWIEEDSEGTLSATSAAHLATLRERVVRMESLLEDLLRYSRLGSEERTLETYRLEALIRDEFNAVDLDSEAILETEGLDVDVLTVGPPLRLCLRNLIQNAIRHRVADKARITIRRAAPLDGGSLVLLVEDDGPGIPDRYRHQVFSLFRKLDHDSSGTGMGLALVRRAVELVGGSVTIEDAEPSGSRFILTWPLHDSVS